MAKHVRCSYCGKKRWMQYVHFKKNLYKFGVVNILELNNSYICKSCVVRLKQINKPSGIRDTPEFKQLQVLLQSEVDILIKRGLNNQTAMSNFQLNVKSTLTHFHTGGVNKVSQLLLFQVLCVQFIVQSAKYIE